MTRINSKVAFSCIDRAQKWQIRQMRMRISAFHANETIIPRYQWSTDYLYNQKQSLFSSMYRKNKALSEAVLNA